MSTEVCNAKFLAIRAAFDKLNTTKSQNDLTAYVSALKDAIVTNFYTSFQSLMDDSGVSDQPFLIEGDGFLMNIFSSLQFDVDVNGTVLAFVYLLEQRLAALIEGQRKLELIFVETIGNLFQSSPYLAFLRSVAIAYIRHTLNINVTIFSTISDENVLPFYTTKAPLFTLVCDGVYNARQVEMIDKLFAFHNNTAGAKFDYAAFQFRLSAFLMYLLQHDKRSARYEEVSSLDGMLQALLYTYNGDQDDAGFNEFSVVFPAEMNAVVYPAPKTSAVLPAGDSAALLTSFSTISTEFITAGIKNDRLAILTCALRFWAEQTKTQISEELAVFVVLNVFSCLLADKLAAQDRPQQIAGKGPFFKNVAATINPLFTALTAYANTIAQADVSALTTLAAGGLFDIFDGLLLSSFFQSTHVDFVKSHLESAKFGQVLDIVSRNVAHGMEKLTNITTTAQALLTKNVITAPVVAEQTVAELSTTVPTFITSSTTQQDAPAAATPAAFLSIQWKDLPAIDAQMLKVLLYALGDNGLVYNQLKDNQQLDASLATNTNTTNTAQGEAAKEEEEPVDDWDAEPLDDWDADGNWDDEPEETEDATTAAATNDAANGDDNTAAKIPPHPKLLGGGLSFDNVEVKNGWNTFQLVGDGSTMPPADKEALFRHNPITVNRDTKYALRKLIIEYQDRSKPIPYQMPPDDKIRQRCEGVPGLTVEKAKQWITITIFNLTIKLENSRLTKANSTKKEYNQSMITPSRVVLRDIVATQQDGDIPSAAKATNTETKEKETHGKKGNQQKKESVQDKVAKELLEKQQKADMDKVNSIINTLKNVKLNKKINELDKKLLAHSDPPSALHGNMTLLEWRVQQWKAAVDNKTTTAATSTAQTSDAMTEAYTEVAVKLVQLLFDLSRRFLHIMTKQHIEAVQQAFAMLGFFDSEVEIGLRWLNATNQAKYTTAKINELVLEALAKTKTTSERRYAVGTTRSRFLLHHAGHILLRNVNSSSDPRVHGFYPDEWQRQLLDIVDNNGSALVVAPTSAGKTLVSFYAVSRVLKQNKELTDSKVHNASLKKGIVVFVAPTFPLARQMESDIANRNKDADVVVHDTNIKLPHMKFDVLITLPQCLENLLTSPSRLDWVKRIKYIIFDEVHSIGSTLNGPVWERLFLLAHQIPFLALSATVGGVEHFHHWLMSMRQKYQEAESGQIKSAPIIADTAITNAQQPSSSVSYIKTDVRWSHLHHYFYVPPQNFFDQAFETLKAGGNNLTVAAVKPPSVTDTFVSLHPIATLALNNSTSLQGTTTPASRDQEKTLASIDRRALEGLFNIEFSTSDSLQLYDAINAVLFKSPRFAPEVLASDQVDENKTKITHIQQELQRLNPDKYFGFFVEKIHTLDYATDLKNFLLKLYDAVLDTEIMEIIASLSDNIRQVLAPLTLATHARRDLWIKNFTPLLRSLQARDWFPAIIFCLDRTLCTDLAYHVVGELEQTEHETWVKENDKRLDKSLKDKEYEAAMKQAKRLRDLQNQKKRGSAEASKELEEDVRMGLVDPAMLDPDYFRSLKPYNPEDWNADKPDERFSFVKETEWMATAVQTYWERRIKRRGSKDEPMNGQHPLIKALYRGFGVHHYGVDKQYRDLVEILFRQKNLKFVISTETLGLGVNMPCRSTVFAFTTVALNPLNYRQMSGRAGRRGFDDKGQVIFFGIDPHHACRLMTSSLTPLRGHYNMSCATILRLCIKFFFAKESQQQLNNNIVNTTINNAKTKIGTSSNLTLLDHMTFLTRSFFTYSEGFPLHVRIQLIHYFRYCLAYFQQLNLFKSDAPTGLAYMLSAIANATASTTTTSSRIPAYINEAGAFSLIYLMRTGQLDALCAAYPQAKEETAEKLMALLCHLFFPVRLRNNTTADVYPQPKPIPAQFLNHADPALVLKPGHVILPDIKDAVSPQIAQALEDHDVEVLKLFSRYSVAVASTTTAVAKEAEFLKGTSSAEYFTPSTMMTFDEMSQLRAQAAGVVSVAQSLPLSNTTTNSVEEKDDVVTDEALLNSFQQTAVQSTLRSPFNTLSTLQGDVFNNPYELVSSIAKLVDLKQSQIPVNVDKYSPDSITLSSYAYDFYLNGCYDDVINCHGINLAEAWEALNRFTKLLQALKKALAILSSNQDEDNDEDFDAGGDADDDGAVEENDENTLEILKKSLLYQNNPHVKENLYVKGDAAKAHKITTECFNHVFKRFFKHFNSIERDSKKK